MLNEKIDHLPTRVVSHVDHSVEAKEYFYSKWLKKYLNSKDGLLVTFFVLLSGMLLWLPSGYEKPVTLAAEQCSSRVIGVDNTHVQQLAMIRTGDQLLTLKILNGSFKGKEIKANNPLMGQMDRDTLYSIGDQAFTVLTLDSAGEIIHVSTQGHDRITQEIFLFGLFALVLLIFGGWTGVKALVSFVFAALCIWKWLIPGLLKGYDPILLTLVVTALMTSAIIFLVGGLTRKGLAAFVGAFSGIALSGGMAMYFTSSFHVHGAIMPFAETLLYSGFGHLNLTKIYVAAIFLASSGAVMDLAMDVAASMNEVYEQNPTISRTALIRSGFNVGRAVTGTMTTTLLFAYSGGFLTLLMAFMAQGIPLANTFNLIYVAAEILKTLIGSLALVTVAPLTAIAGGFILSSSRKNS